MKAVFTDSSFYQALISKRDAHHEEAVELAGLLPDRLLTTEWVLAELLNSFSRGRQARRDAINLTDALRANPNVAVAPVSPRDFARGLQLFRDRLDKDWSLVDCISFQVMWEGGLTHAVTFDDHFGQAGFKRFGAGLGSARS